MSTPTPTFWVKKHPSPSALATALVNLPVAAAPGEYEQMTEPALEAWKAAELAAGWTPQPEPAPPESVPASASRESVLIELALATVSEALPAGLTDEHIAAHIAGIADPLARTTARLESQRSVWRRAHPLIGQIGAALTPPITSEQIDEIFRRAAARDAAPL